MTTTPTATCYRNADQAEEQFGSLAQGVLDRLATADALADAVVALGAGVGAR